MSKKGSSNFAAPAFIERKPRARLPENGVETERKENQKKPIWPRARV